MGFVGTVLELLTDTLITFLIGVVELLPDSPFTFIDDFEAPATVIMSYVNWFIDFPTIYNIFLTWLGAVLGWYVYRTVFKWAKMAG